MMPRVPRARRAGAWLVLWCTLAALLSVVSPPVAGAVPKRKQVLRRPNLHARRLLRCGNAQVMPNPSNLATVARATLCLVNRERGARGLSLLSKNGALDHAASNYSASMVSSDYFSDVSPSGSTLGQRISRSGYLGRGSRSRSARVLDAENLATASGDLATPESVVRAWMDSPPHRANLLGADFRATGMGVALGMAGPEAGEVSEPAATYTQYFGAIG